MSRRDLGPEPPRMIVERVGDYTTLRDNWPAVLAWLLRREGVGEAVAERVLRLNPVEREGERLRGLRRTADERWEMLAMRRAISKGEFLRRYGREAFARLPADVLRKRGKRVYVTHRAALSL